jgi:hypothetical protein
LRNDVAVTNPHGSGGLLLIKGDRRLSEIAIGFSFAFTGRSHAEASPSAFINKLNSSPLKCGLDCFDSFLGNLTPFFFKIYDG